MTRLLRWTNVLLILATFLSYLSPMVNPDSFWIPSIFGLAFPWLILGNILFIIFWGLKKDRYVIYSLGCFILGWGYFNKLFGFNGKKEVSGEKLTLITYNAHHFSGKSYKKPDKNGFSNFLKNAKGLEEIDLFTIQEIHGKRVKEISKTLKLPHSTHAKTNAIISKFPILKEGALEFENTSNSCVWADVKTKLGTIRVYSLHLQSNMISGTTDKIAKDGDLREKETWSDIKTVVGRYKYAAQIRVKQAKKIAEHMSKSPHPVIICGDLNDTPMSWVYELLSKNKKDSFCESGRGFGTTYGGSIPTLRIDYILADPDFELGKHEVLDYEYSDHFPVYSEVSIN